MFMFRFFCVFPSAEYFGHGLSHKGGIWTGHGFVFYPTTATDNHRSPD